MYTPAHCISVPFMAMIRGKFIYTPRSSQPIGMGRIALISDTDIKKLTIKNAISALMRRGFINPISEPELLSCCSNSMYLFLIS